MIDKGEVLFVESRNFTKYAFRDGSKNEIWIEWHNDFEHVHPKSQWLVKLLVDARKELTSLMFYRAWRHRNARIKGKEKPKTFEEAEGRIAFLEKQVSNFEKAEKARLKNEKKWEKMQRSRKKEGGDMNLHYMKLIAENAQLKTQITMNNLVREDVFKENYKLRKELHEFKLQKWLKGEEE